MAGRILQRCLPKEAGPQGNNSCRDTGKCHFDALQRARRIAHNYVSGVNKCLTHKR